MADNTCNSGSNCGSCSSCGPDSCDNLDQFLQEIEREDTLSRIKHRVVVLSGKGGVGKSTVAVNLAVSLALRGKHVGLLDVDIHGPSVPKMLKLEGTRPVSVDGKLVPVGYETLKVMSIGFLLNDADSAVIWRGPMKAGVIKQFVEEVSWDALDYLIVDCPPGTGDEPLSVIQTLGNADGAVVVTTPQDVALADVRKSIKFCEQVELPVLGVVENMSGFICPHCDEVVEIFKTGGGEKMADEMGVPFLGKVPLEPKVVDAGDDGKPYVYAYSKTSTAQAFEGIVSKLMATVEQAKSAEEKDRMRIAIPTVDKELCMHFGHCDEFAIIDVEGDEIVNVSYVPAPDHQPGLLPKWLNEQGVNVVIAGGMGSRAQGLFAEVDIKVITGAPANEPEAVVKAYLSNSLVIGANVCDH